MWEERNFVIHLFAFSMTFYCCLFVCPTLSPHSKKKKKVGSYCSQGGGKLWWWREKIGSSFSFGFLRIFLAMRNEWIFFWGEKKFAIWFVGPWMHYGHFYITQNPQKKRRTLEGGRWSARIVRCRQHLSFQIACHPLLPLPPTWPFYFILLHFFFDLRKTRKNVKSMGLIS